MSAFCAAGRLTGMFIGVEIQMSFASSDIIGVGKGRELFCGWHSSRP
jgi:hypothetical protein